MAAETCRVVMRRGRDRLNFLSWYLQLYLMNGDLISTGFWGDDFVKRDKPLKRLCRVHTSTVTCLPPPARVALWDVARPPTCDLHLTRELGGRPSPLTPAGGTKKLGCVGTQGGPPPLADCLGTIKGWFWSREKTRTGETAHTPGTQAPLLCGSGCAQRACRRWSGLTGRRRRRAVRNLSPTPLRPPLPTWPLFP
jgi:hypothetical protein